MSRLGEKLGRLVEASGKSVREVAKLAGIDNSRLGKVINNQANQCPTVPQLFALAKYFRVTMESLADDAIPDPVARHSDGLTEDERYILQVVRDSGLRPAEVVRRLVVPAPTGERQRTIMEEKTQGKESAAV